MLSTLEAQVIPPTLKNPRPRLHPRLHPDAWTAREIRVRRRHVAETLGHVYAHDYAAAAYDLIHESRGKSYRTEAEQIAEQIRCRHPGARRLLDVACGTGLHMAAFADLGFEVVGVETSPAMLQAARQRVPGVPLHEGDMRTFDLDDRSDAVVCLFSAIGYMTTTSDLTQAIANMATHRAPGGVLVVEPWFGPDDWAPNTLHADSAKNDSLAVARVNRSGRDGNVSTIDMRYVVATVEGIETFTEYHRMGLFSPAQYRQAFEHAGLDVEHDEDGLIGRGLYIGTSKP
jgi:dTDP-3-amino-3,6-dideoxy-alpha-D-glucopyranose N,N-dimethyltransferase/dTDP-3-amino-3,4,6-trideoxy-alpha-D-glucopyranose N,N-dimethyltransferase/N-methyltransferase